MASSTTADSSIGVEASFQDMLAGGAQKTNDSDTFPTMQNPVNDKFNRIVDCLLKPTNRNSEGSACLWELRALALSQGGLVKGVYHVVRVYCDFYDGFYRQSLAGACTDRQIFSHTIFKLSCTRSTIPLLPYRQLDELRQRSWPSLVGLRQDEPWVEETTRLFDPTPVTAKDVSASTPGCCSEEEDRERDLIRRDVGRSVLFHHSCPSPNSVMDSSGVYGGGGDDAASVKSNAELSTSLLAAVLTAAISSPLPMTTTSTDATTTTKMEKPHYYQGLHDIGGVLLHNLGYNEVITTAILRRLLQTHLRDCCKDTFSDLQWLLQSTLLPLVQKLDPPVYEAIVLSGVPIGSTILPWMLTWFTHSIHDEEGASRLVDAFIASHPLLPFYVSLALLMHPSLRTDLLTVDLDDPSSMHFAIQNLPSRIKSDWSHTTTSGDGDDYIVYVKTQDIIDTAVSIM